MEPVIQVIKLPFYQIVTFWCPLCQTRHSFYGHLPNQKVPIHLDIKPVFRWNGDECCPTVEDSCILIQTPRTQKNPAIECHVQILDGKFGGSYISEIEYKTVTEPLLPVSQWPLKPPPNEPEKLQQKEH